MRAVALITGIFFLLIAWHAVGEGDSSRKTVDSFQCSLSSASLEWSNEIEVIFR